MTLFIPHCLQRGKHRQMIDFSHHIKTDEIYMHSLPKKLYANLYSYLLKTQAKISTDQSFGGLLLIGKEE